MHGIDEGPYLYTRLACCVCMQGIAPAIQERFAEWRFPRDHARLLYPSRSVLKECDRFVRLRLADNVPLRDRPAALCASLAQLTKLQIECGVLVLQDWCERRHVGSEAMYEMRDVFEDAKDMLPQLQLLDGFQPWLCSGLVWV